MNRNTHSCYIFFNSKGDDYSTKKNNINKKILIKINTNKKNNTNKKKIILIKNERTVLTIQ